MSRFLPRRTRQMWILFLLGVCVIGIYITYSQLTKSEKHIPAQALPYQLGDLDLDNMHHEVKHFDFLKKKKPILDTHLAELAQQDLKPVFRNLENDEDYVTDGERVMQMKDLLTQLSPHDWKMAPDAGDMILMVKDKLIDLGYVSPFSCKDINRLKIGGSMRQSFYGKKSIDRAYRDFAEKEEFVVKSLGNDHSLKVECMKQDYNADRCSVMSNYKLMRELLLLLILDNPAIIKLKGFCLRGETIDPRIHYKGTLIVTESGKFLTTNNLELFLWRDRLKFSYELVQLVEYLEGSPLGSLGFDKLHLQDFVFLDDPRYIKLVDLDNIHLGEIECRVDTDCIIPEMAKKKIRCVDHRCAGRNRLNNLLWIYRVMLYPMLRKPPLTGNTASELDMQRWLSGIQDLRYTVQEVQDKLKQMYDAAEKRANSLYLKYDDTKDVPRLENEVAKQRLDSYRDKKKKQETAEKRIQKDSNKMEALEQQKMVKEVPAGNDYIRKNESNYPGMFDFTCSLSRVSWGCVVSVKTLREARAFCDQQDMCKAFVVFSSNPDQEALMTMVMKNSADAKPETNFGATMFIKKTKSQPPETGPKKEKNWGDNVVTIPSCRKKVLNITGSARYSRERRLMTHLGLKGMFEDEWKMKAKTLGIKSYKTSQISSQNVKGGRYKVTFDSNTSPLGKGEFLLEKGPLHHHVAYMLAYLLDRELGLYSVPPSVPRSLTLDEIRKIKGGNTVGAALQPYSSDNITIHGIMTLPVPPVMKTDKFTILSVEAMPIEVKAFSRTEKLQLEYLLLWATVNLMNPQHGYLGYKGHMVHFEADLAFQKAHQSMISYFYNCQFPSITYKILTCYRCSGHSNSQICGLGQMVVHQMVAAGFSEQEIQINNYTSVDLINLINNSMEEVLAIIDKCIRTFTREKVLY